MTSLIEALVVANGADDGYELTENLALSDGTAVAAEDLSSQTTPTNDEFRRDLVTVNATTGALSVTEGAETDDQDKASAEAPAIPEGEIVLAVGVMTADTGTPSVDSVEHDRRGEASATVSADEDHVA